MVGVDDAVDVEVGVAVDVWVAEAVGVVVDMWVAEAVGVDEGVVLRVRVGVIVGVAVGVRVSDIGFVEVLVGSVDGPSTSGSAKPSIRKKAMIRVIKPKRFEERYTLRLILICSAIQVRTIRRRFNICCELSDDPPVLCPDFLSSSLCSTVSRWYSKRFRAAIEEKVRQSAVTLATQAGERNETLWKLLVNSDPSFSHRITQITIPKTRSTAKRVSLEPCLLSERFACEEGFS